MRASSRKINKAVAHRRRKVASWVVISAATAYLVHIVVPEIGSIGELFSRIGILQFVLSVACAVPMLLLSARYHAELVDRMSPGEANLLRLATSYLQAQLVRYLPGKVWGLVYQSHQLLDSHKPEVIVLANLFQMVMTSALAFGIVTSVLSAAFLQSIWPLGLIFPVIGLVEIVHRNPKVEQWAISAISRAIPERLYRLTQISMTPSRWRATAVLLLEWLFYYLMFAILLHGVMNGYEVFLLASWYAGASLLAVAAIIVPAGIAVREAIFVSAASLLPGDPATLIAIATLLRASSVAAELMAATLGTAALRVQASAT